ncbi:MAG: hypothetical protein M5R36_20435 [Deltaproteobacteria bacterium]|nr:hypothetical protein [Deltaproteobacteria bacterium]
MRRRAAIAFLLLAVSCAAKKEADDTFKFSYDRQLDEYIAAIQQSLADLEVESADAAYTAARDRLQFLLYNPYASRAILDYRERLIALAARIVETKKNVRGMPRLVFYRGYESEQGRPRTGSP